MKNIVCYLLTFIPLLLHSQTDENYEARILFERAYTLKYAHQETDLINLSVSNDDKEKAIANKIIDQLWNLALKDFNTIITDYPNSDVYSSSLHHKGIIEYYFKNHEEAKSCFEKFIVSDSRYVTDSSINTCYLYLAQIAIEEEKYDQAIEYLDESKKYKKTYTCGTAANIAIKRLNSLYQKCYDGLKK